MEQQTIREAVAVFDDAAKLEDAVSELQSNGIDRSELSFLAHPSFPGHMSRDLRQAADDPATPREPVVSDTDLRQGRVLGTGLAATLRRLLLIRLGGPNFNEIPVNQPKCPWANMQRDGHMRMHVAKGRVNYEPNTLAPEVPRAGPSRRFTGFTRDESGHAMRIRPESFADHYSQARMFFQSQTETEKNHIVSALVFELSKVETPPVRERVVSHLMHVDEGMVKRVAAGLRLGSGVEPATDNGTGAPRNQTLAGRKL
jgi:hypothetical protein